MIKIKNIDHIVLRVSDLERSIIFYTNILGCEVERRVEHINLVQLRAGAHMIDLIPREPNEETPGFLDHFCLRVEPFDAESIRQFLRARGIETDAPAIRYGAEGKGMSIYFKDPDGITIELKGPTIAPAGI